MLAGENPVNKTKTSTDEASGVHLRMQRNTAKETNATRATRLTATNIRIMKAALGNTSGADP